MSLNIKHVFLNYVINNHITGETKDNARGLDGD